MDNLYIYIFREYSVSKQGRTSKVSEVKIKLKKIINIAYELIGNKENFFLCHLFSVVYT